MSSKGIPVPEDENTPDQRQVFLTQRSRVIVSLFIAFLVLSVVIGLVVGLQFKVNDTTSIGVKRRSGLLDLVLLIKKIEHFG